MAKLQRLIIALLVVCVLGYMFKSHQDTFMTYESATTPNAISKRFEPFKSLGGYASALIGSVGPCTARGGCPSTNKSHRMCLEMAGSVCRIPTYPNNECWMSVFNKCRNKCSNERNCDCTTTANQMCGTRGDPAEACLNSTYQKCMAGRTITPDPDRGMPAI